MNQLWIATRLLLDPTGQRVEVAIGVPYDDGRNWYCPYRIERAGEVTIKKAGGEDALQSLALAIEALSHSLEQSGATLTWHVLQNDTPIPTAELGDTGIYRLLPSALGFPFYNELRKLVDGQIEQRAEELRRQRAPVKP